jgi:hypothetical protein
LDIAAVGVRACAVAGCRANFLLVTIG